MKFKKSISISDIFKKLDLSSATVSLGLNNIQAINKNTRKLGYRHSIFVGTLEKQNAIEV
jgi:DNA-binding transcriptional regulator GbsR (MarR family)